MSKPAPLTPSQKMQVLSKSDGHCFYCGILLTVSTMVRDHFIPISGGGLNRLENSVAACPTCNGIKSDLSIEQFRTALKQPDVIRRRGIQGYQPFDKNGAFYFEIHGLKS